MPAGRLNNPCYFELVGLYSSCTNEPEIEMTTFIRLQAIINALKNQSTVLVYVEGKVLKCER